MTYSTVGRVGERIMKADKKPILVVGNHSDGLGLPLEPLPKIKKQRRKKQAQSSLQTWNMIGADTETKKGRVWLFSTEAGVWEIPTFAHLMSVLYNDQHTRRWKKGGKRGIRCLEYFFWNLKFDAQAVLKTLSDQVILDLISSRDTEDDIGTNKVVINADTGDYLPEAKGRMVELNYLEGKSFIITPKNWYRGRFRLGPCHWWDISQYYNKMRLNTASEIYLGENKIERLFDGNILDASKFDDDEYTDYYREDIDDYAIKDAILAGRLARRKRDEFVKAGVRFIRPYSLANSAQRALLDTCSVPTVNDYAFRPKTKLILEQANSAYRGGWFETIGSGYHPDITCMDLVSAYPYIIYHLPDLGDKEGTWFRGSGDDGFVQWLEYRKPFEIGFCEAFFLFDAGLPWYPLARMSSTGTIVTPRMVRGWFTAEEIVEALKWPHSQCIIGDWCFFQDTDVRPFQPFIQKFYEMKMNSEKGSAEYAVAKVCLNSIYGKKIQAINNKAGALWSPAYASTITGATRARLAELVRVNGYSAVGVATDGVLLPSEDLKTIPRRPLPAPFDLGEWDMEDQGELCVLMSGVYSIRNGSKTKTKYRGSASLFLGGYGDGGLFRFCAEHQDDYTKTTSHRRPYSAKEARVRNDMSLINVFEEHNYSIQPCGDSTKRLWSGPTPQTFGDLLTQWWTSTPHQQVH